MAASTQQPALTPSAVHEHHYHYHYHTLPHYTQKPFGLPSSFRVVDPHPAKSLKEDSGHPPLYKSHPIYPLRRLIIINAIAGLILTGIAYNMSYYMNMQVWQYGILVMCVSGALAVGDLWSWVHRKMKEEKLCYVCLGVCRRKQPATAAEEEGRAGVAASETDRLLDVDVGHTYTDAATTPDGSTDLEQGLSSRDAAMDASLPTPSTSAPNTPAPPSPPVNINTSDQSPSASKAIWPTLILLILEFLLILGLLFGLAVEWIDTANNFNTYNAQASFIRAYATVATIFAILLHIRCWWAAVRERRKQRSEKQEAGRCMCANACAARG